MSEITEFKRNKIEHTQNRIRQVANKLFKQKGLAKVNFDDIAKAALISRSTLYNYYENKEAIYFNLHVVSVLEAMDVSLKDPPNLAENLSGNLSGKQIILDMCAKLMDSFQEHWINSYVLNEFLRESVISTPKTPEQSSKKPSYASKQLKYRYTTLKKSISQYFQFLESYVQIWEQVIQRGLADGSIRTNISPSLLITYLRMVLVGIMDQAHIQWISPERKEMQPDFQQVKQLTLGLISTMIS